MCHLLPRRASRRSSTESNETRLGCRRHQRARRSHACGVRCLSNRPLNAAKQTYLPLFWSAHRAIVGDHEGAVQLRQLLDRPSQLPIRDVCGVGRMPGQRVEDERAGAGRHIAGSTEHEQRAHAMTLAPSCAMSIARSSTDSKISHRHHAAAEHTASTTERDTQSP
jgi:hypothetical protein